MSLNSDKLSDIKSLYENIHFNDSEEVLTEGTENLDEIAVNFGGQKALAAKQAELAQQRQSQSRIDALRQQRFGSGGSPSAGGGAKTRADLAGSARPTPSAQQSGMYGRYAPPSMQQRTPAPARPATPAAPARPAAGAPAPVGGAKAAPSTTPTGGAKPMSAMDQWRAANPKLAAAADEKARIRGTAQTDNPLMKDMRSGMRAGAPTVQSPAVAKLGAGNQSLVNNPNAGRSPAPAPSLGQRAFSSPTPGASAFRAATPAQATAAAPSTSPAASGSVAPVSNRLAAQSSAQQAKSPTFSQAMRMPSLMQSFEYDDLYDLVIEYLIDDGHADTLDEAAYIISEMEAATIADIVEAKYGTAKGRKALAKKVRAGKDVGKKGEGFKKIVKGASKKYGKERATKIAAAAMWKNLAKEE